MVHLLLYGLLAIVLAAVLFVVAARFLPAGEQIAPPLRDEPPWELPPDRALHPEDVDSVRLPVALRGYRFAETDILLDRLAGELRSRDQEILRLRGGTNHIAPLAGEDAPPDRPVEEPRLADVPDEGGPEDEPPPDHALFAPPAAAPPTDDESDEQRPRDERPRDAE